MDVMVRLAQLTRRLELLESLEERCKPRNYDKQVADLQEAIEYCRDLLASRDYASKKANPMEKNNVD